MPRVAHQYIQAVFAIVMLNVEADLDGAVVAGVSKGACADRLPRI